MINKILKEGEILEESFKEYEIFPIDVIKLRKIVQNSMKINEFAENIYRARYDLAKLNRGKEVSNKMNQTSI